MPTCATGPPPVPRRAIAEVFDRRVALRVARVWTTRPTAALLALGGRFEQDFVGEEDEFALGDDLAGEHVGGDRVEAAQQLQPG